MSRKQFREDFPLGSTWWWKSHPRGEPVSVRIVGHTFKRPHGESAIDVLQISRTDDGSRYELSGPSLGELASEDQPHGHYRLRPFPDYHVIAVQRRGYPPRDSWYLDEIIYRPAHFATHQYYVVGRSELGHFRDNVSVGELHLANLREIQESVFHTGLGRPVSSRELYGTLSDLGLDRAEFRRLARRVFPSRQRGSKSHAAVKTMEVT